MYKKIEDYGIIGDSQCAALVGRDGSIDWLCLPSMDSPSVFAALLDHDRGGRFAVSPVADWDSVQQYRPGTNVLETTFRTSSGRICLTDFLPIPTPESPAEESRCQQLYRRLEGLEGKVEIAVEFQPRFDYARGETTLEATSEHILARCGQESIVLQAAGLHLDLEKDRAVGCAEIAAGDSVWLHLVHGQDHLPPFEKQAAEGLLQRTCGYWQDWLTKSETGQDLDFGPFAPMIERSSLVLKLLQFAPSGAVAAAPTTSLPEEIGGERNWDYRFSWIRDSALTVEALFNIGHMSEMENYLSWLHEFVCAGGGKLQILYGLRGEADIEETQLQHLAGYKGSAPVRIGNAAFDQRQLDIYGEIMDAALRLSNYVGKIDFALWPFLRTICDEAAATWREADAGIWEVRGGYRHFVYSKVMCWVALDRGLTIARRYGFPGDLDLWREQLAVIREEVLAKGWSEDKQALVQHYDTDALDASILLLPFYGFLDYDDPRMISTVEAIERELSEDGYVYRYRSADGLRGGEGTFLLCTFWLIDNLIGQGRLDEAQIGLLRLERTANQLGLFAEEYDPFWREALGNFPQAFTHIGYINSVFSLCRARGEGAQPVPERNLKQIMRDKLLFVQRYVLNDGEREQEEPDEGIVRELKQLMNLLRGAFFSTDAGRIAYERMAESELYHRYVACARQLAGFDLDELTSREERLAFWINLFNVLVIHGVIELGIRNSVKEVTRFFRRIGYRIGGLEFTADDIEHGILRGNQRFPGSLFHPFDAEDPRRSHQIQPPEPRIHFALVCASASCPPIEVYSAESLEEDLEISGKTFLNASVRIDREQGKIWLPQIFQWYGDDFGEGEEDYLRFIAPYLFREEDRNYVREKAAELKVAYLDYDWRLNRT